MVSYFEQQLKPYCSLPAASGAKDPALLDLARSIDLSTPSVLLDYGCGQGRLLAALAACRSSEELSRLAYIGVDAHEEPLGLAREYFNQHLSPTGACSAFLTTDVFAYQIIPIDHAVMIFCLHEVDPLVVDHVVAHIWSLLRPGGVLHIQDSSAAIHQEIEYLALAPEQIADLLHELTPLVSWDSKVAGRRKIAVFHVRAERQVDDTPEYKPRDLSSRYREVLHESLLGHCYELYELRSRFESGEEVDPDTVARLCHVVAVRARAYHQTLAFDSVNRRAEEYCVRCGSRIVDVQYDHGDHKSGSHLVVSCRACGYVHEYEPGTRGYDDARDRLEFMTGVRDRGESLEINVRRCLDRWVDELQEVGIAVLERVPDVSSEMIQNALASSRPRRSGTPPSVGEKSDQLHKARLEPRTESATTPESR